MLRHKTAESRNWSEESAQRGESVRLVVVGLISRKGMSREESLLRAPEDEIHVEWGVWGKVEVLFKGGEGEGELRVPPRIGQVTHGPNSEIVGKGDRLPRLIEDRPPVRSVRGQIDLKIVTTFGVAQEEFRRVILPEFRLKDILECSRMHAGRLLMPCLEEEKAVGEFEAERGSRGGGLSEPIGDDLAMMGV